MKESGGVGKRLAYARRLLGAAMGEDLSMAKAAALIGVTNPSWWRWEVEKEWPAEQNLKAFIEVCRQYGLTGVTLAWLRYGSGEGPPQIGKPLEPAKRRTPVIKKSGREVTREDFVKKPASKRRA